MLEREVALYRALRPHLGGISFITYGGAGDLRYAAGLDGIQVLCNRWNMPARLYRQVLPFIHRLPLLRSDVLKTNQTKGAEVALLAKRLYGKKMVARCGYMWSEHAARRSGEASAEASAARQIEERAFRDADRVVVTTAMMKEMAERTYGLPASKVQVIPNYVCTDLFQPRPEMHHPRTVCFVGRLEPQKNPLALMDGLAGLDVRLIMIGKGYLRAALERRARTLGLNVDFIQRVPHIHLSDHMNRAAVFVLPSHYEGHPKTLLEAMSCGLPVVGANAPGIHELIRHGETGYLCGTDPASIRAAIHEVLGNPRLQAELGRNARQYVVENFSLERVVGMELALLQEIAGDGR